MLPVQAAVDNTAVCDVSLLVVSSPQGSKGVHNCLTSRITPHISQPLNKQTVDHCRAMAASFATLEQRAVRRSHVSPKNVAREAAASCTLYTCATLSAPSRRPARQRLAGARDASTRRCTQPLAWKTSIFIVVTRQMCRLPLLLGEHLLHPKKSHLHLPCPPTSTPLVLSRLSCTAVCKTTI